MRNESNIPQGRHCIFKLHVHWVFVAKYRRRVFDAEAIDVLRGIFVDVCSDAHTTRVQMDGEDDHVHLLVEYPPKVAVSSLANSLKGVSSRLLRQQRPDIRKRYWKGVLAQLLRFLLRRSAHQHRVPTHRAAEDPELTFTTASLSALSFALKDGACRASWSPRRMTPVPAVHEHRWPC
jgi:putative transposase